MHAMTTNSAMCDTVNGRSAGLCRSRDRRCSSDGARLGSLPAPDAGDRPRGSTLDRFADVALAVALVRTQNRSAMRAPVADATRGHDGVPSLVRALRPRGRPHARSEFSPLLRDAILASFNSLGVQVGRMLGTRAGHPNPTPSSQPRATVACARDRFSRDPEPSVAWRE